MPIWVLIFEQMPATTSGTYVDYVDSTERHTEV